MRLLFGQSYYLRFDDKLHRAMQPYPPLGSMYAAAVARDAGHEVALFDAMLAESTDEWESALEEVRPEVAALFEDNFNYLSKMCLLRMREAAFRMIGMARDRGVEVVVCGSDATDHAAAYLDAGARAVIVGEGEAVLREYLARMETDPAYAMSAIQGLVYRDRGEIVHTPPRPPIRDLDSLPFPARDLIDVNRYRNIWLERHGYFSTSMVTTRGCPFHCNWCAKPIWGQRYNARSPENVVAEMKWLKENWWPDHIWFMDDIMGLKPGWLDRFAAVLKEHGAVIPFKSLNRPDLLLRNGDIDALRRAGCRTVWMGAESGSQRILDAMEKGTDVAQIEEAAARLKDSGIEVGFFIQYGYPGEEWDDIRKTLGMISRCEPDDIGISVSYPLPGTKFYTAVRDQLGDRQNWVDSGDLAMMYRGTYSTAFYRRLHRLTHVRFHAGKLGREIRAKTGKPTAIRLGDLWKLGRLVGYAILIAVERYRLVRLSRPQANRFRPPAKISDRTEAAVPTLQK